MRQLKKITFLLLYLYPLSVFAGEIEFTLHSDWQFRQVKTETWMPAKVPGTVHTDLLSNGKIDDPHFGDNYEKQRWIENEDWEYKTSFQVVSDVLTRDKIFIDFNGLDTFADVYLNDSLILKANNMFRSWQVDVEGIIKSGINELRVYFHSPLKKGRQVHQNFGNSLEDKHMTSLIRKAAYHFGEAGGPKILTSGIWRSVKLRAWDVATIKDLSIHPISIEAQSAKLVADLTYQVTRPFFGEVEIKVDGRNIKKSIVELQHGMQKDNLAFSIDDPILWWPNGMGDQKMYDIEITLKKEGTTLVSRKISTGLRTVELVSSHDQKGEGFQFNINGKSVNVKGASYVPMDYFIPQIDEKHYRSLLQSATNANINLLRLSSVGIYEEDVFYDICDELGILVWQDFMIQGSVDAMDVKLVSNIKTEADENVRRLRHHPSVALWSGDGNTLKEKDLLSMMVNEVGNGVPFWESAPNNLEKGHKKEADDLLQQAGNVNDRNNHGLILGHEFLSLPALSTIQSFSDANDRDELVDVLSLDEHLRGGLAEMETFLGQQFQAPSSFESYIYLSQLLQAEAIKTNIEAQRLKGRNHTLSFIGQLNDSWPLVSSALVDYSGMQKAGYHYAKRALKAVTLLFKADEEEINVHVSNELLEELKADILIELLDLNGKKIFTEQKKIRVKAQSVDLAWKNLLKNLLRKQKKEDVYLRARIMDGDELLAENTFIFETYKNMNIQKNNIKYDFVEENGKLFIDLRTDKTDFGVCFDSGDLKPKYSDNYFILHAKEPKRVEIYGNDQAFEIRNKLTVKSLYDSHTP